MAISMLRDFFLGFIKIHILYHASKARICGVEMMEELKRHGYEISPGTLYPTLHSLEEKGYLKSEEVVEKGRIRRYYRITKRGKRMLTEAREKIRELVEEVLE
jgi:DNA-binding PadR family transcriptional regulator